jgi:hypothetical protein
MLFKTESQKLDNSNTGRIYDDPWLEGDFNNLSEEVQVRCLLKFFSEQAVAEVFRNNDLEKYYIEVFHGALAESLSEQFWELGGISVEELRRRLSDKAFLIEAIKALEWSLKEGIYREWYEAQPILWFGDQAIASRKEPSHISAVSSGST